MEIPGSKGTLHQISRITTDYKVNNNVNAFFHQMIFTYVRCDGKGNG